MSQLQEYVDGLIEVQGRVNEKSEIECTGYFMFPGHAENFGKLQVMKKAMNQQSCCEFCDPMAEVQHCRAGVISKL